ncbi:MAG: PAS domain-containing protein, partial [bacterium]|nr:PAS domain-containing protein [bacterium]
MAKFSRHSSNSVPRTERKPRSSDFGPHSTPEDFESFFELSRDLLTIVNADGRILHANRTACEILEYKLSELVGKPVLDLHPPELRAEAETLFG